MKRTFYLLGFLLLGLVGCLPFLPPLNPLPDATYIGANKAGFMIGEDVIIPQGGVLTRNFSHNVQTNRMLMYIKCAAERRSVKYEFELELRDSLFAGGSFLSDRQCSWQTYLPFKAFCVKLEDLNTGRVYAGHPDHQFELLITHMIYGDLRTSIRVDANGDTLRSSSRSLICAGTFSGTLAATNGELITIEKGRFDFSDSEDVN